MIETLTLITLCMLYLIYVRPGKTPPLNNPLVIERPGKYHALLAPNLNLAQTFVESIAQSLLESSSDAGNSTTQIFEVQDTHVTAHGHAAYLLAITKRNGMLYFQVTAPVNNSDHLQTISEFSQKELEKHPPAGDPDDTVNQEIVSAVLQIAKTKNIEIAQIQ
jgi:hypothetical protein